MNGAHDKKKPAARDEKFEHLSEDSMLKEELEALTKGRPEAGELRHRIEVEEKKAKDKEEDEKANPEVKGRKVRRDTKGQAEDEGPYMIGLALSGGGIRSATVSLGILQKLAGAGLLKNVDYLSTVSGGGYIGSALTWWLRKPTRFDTGDELPFGARDPREPEAATGNPKTQPLTPLQYLRGQGNYLIPGNGITLWSGVIIVLRAILLNLMIWIPATALVIGVLYALGYLPGIQGLPYAVRMLAPGTLETAAEIVGTSKNLGADATIPPLFLLMLVFAVVLAIIFVLGSVNHSLLSWTGLTETELRAGRPADATNETSKWYSWLLVGVAGVVDLILLGAVVLGFQPAIELLFTDSDQWAQSAGMPPTLEASFITAFLLWGFLAACTILCFLVMHRRVRDGWTDKTQKSALVALLGLLGIAVAGYLVGTVFAGLHVTLGTRIGAFLLFFFAVAYIVLTNYLIGLLIRHLLRNEVVGKQQSSKQVPTQALLQYRARRTFEWFYGWALSAIVVLVIIGSLPLVSNYIRYGLGGVWTALGLAVTLGGQLWSRVRGNSRLTEITIILGSAVFAYGILLVSHRLAVTFMNGDSTVRALIGAAAIAALLVGWFVNTNQIGLHRFYRDRLMEAFLPDHDALKQDTNTAATGANEFKLTECWDAASAKGPYQIINTNMVLAKSPRRKYRLRGGDNFMLTAQFIGSSATGWYRTKATASADMTLASAMAISGAAANPRGAAGGHGLTRSPTVALVMSLLNIRLGFWIPNPSRGKLNMLLRRPNHFWPGGAYALTSRGYVETSKWLELADGGHFENLAVYELVRRRCGLIIICDGGQDNASSYGDLVTAVQRVGQDFGATVHFDMAVKAGRKFEKSGPAQMIANPTLTDYPKGAEFAEKGYFVGRIDYGKRGGTGWPRSGILIYLKSALIRDLAVGAKGYRGAHHDFPNESTGDQFFDEEQFEAYREVGYRICEQMIAELDLTTLFEDGRPELARLRSNRRFWPVS